MGRRRRGRGDRKAQRTIAAAQALMAIMEGLNRRWDRQHQLGLEQRRFDRESARDELALRREERRDRESAARELRYQDAADRRDRESEARERRYQETSDRAERRFELSEKWYQSMMEKADEERAGKGTNLGVAKRVIGDAAMRTRALGSIAKHGGLKEAIEKMIAEEEGLRPSGRLSEQIGPEAEMKAERRKDIMDTIDALRAMQSEMGQEPAPDLQVKPQSSPQQVPGVMPGQQTGMAAPGMQQPGAPQQGPPPMVQPGGVVDAMLSLLMNPGDPMQQALGLSVGYGMYKQLTPAPDVPALDAVVQKARGNMLPSLMTNTTGQRIPASALGREATRDDVFRDLEELRRISGRR